MAVCQACSKRELLHDAPTRLARARAMQRRKADLAQHSKLCNQREDKVRPNLGDGGDDIEATAGERLV